MNTPEPAPLKNQIEIVGSDLRRGKLKPGDAPFEPYPVDILEKLFRKSETLRVQFETMEQLCELLGRYGNLVVPLTVFRMPHGAAMPDPETLATAMKPEPIGILTGRPMNAETSGMKVGYYQVDGIHFDDNEPLKLNRPTATVLLQQLQDLFRHNLLQLCDTDTCHALVAECEPDSFLEARYKFASFAAVERDFNKVKFVWPAERAVPELPEFDTGN